MRDKFENVSTRFTLKPLHVVYKSIVGW